MLKLTTCISGNIKLSKSKGNMCKTIQTILMMQEKDNYIKLTLPFLDTVSSIVNLLFIMF